VINVCTTTTSNNQCKNNQYKIVTSSRCSELEASANGAKTEVRSKQMSLHRVLTYLFRLATNESQIVTNQIKLECGPMPNLMVALPNTGGALCSTPQSLADAHY